MTEQIRNDIHTLMRLAGLPLPEERVPRLSAGLQLTAETARALAAIDYGEAEPAGRFRAPPP
jgi:hypothetical protein